MEIITLTIHELAQSSKLMGQILLRIKQQYIVFLFYQEPIIPRIEQKFSISTFMQK